MFVQAKTSYEVLDVRDKAEAIRAYGKIAKDRTIENDGVLPQPAFPERRMLDHQSICKE